MPKTILLKEHLTSAQLHERYENSRDSVLRQRWKALYLTSAGLSGAAVARELGKSRSWVSRVVSDYNAFGHEWAKVLPRGEGGRKLEITCQELRLLHLAISKAATRARQKKLRHKVNIKALVGDLEEATGKRRPESTVRRYVWLLATLQDESQVVPGYKVRPEELSPRQQRELEGLSHRCLEELRDAGQEA